MGYVDNTEGLELDGEHWGEFGSITGTSPFSLKIRIIDTQLPSCQIGYYHVCGADRSILNDTDFFPYYSVYEGAWRRITQAVLTTSRMNMTVLIGTYSSLFFIPFAL